LTRHPEVAAALKQLAGKVSDQDIRRMNYSVDGEHREVQEVVRNFLRSKHLD